MSTEPTGFKSVDGQCMKIDAYRDSMPDVPLADCGATRPERINGSYTAARLMAHQC